MEFKEIYSKIGIKVKALLEITSRIFDPRFEILRKIFLCITGHPHVFLIVIK
ncbi:hypothetical protein SAMN05443144_11064 [Fodinibius roseus]|uniref:Uncharacterized protein n=1 Tax=Fodinibius roseus TaxID=1194090 RepID=A0A1M5CRD0_9BACT|nr:hypothetical protein SAMN05443144_11064 [Fodinibius roseus]